MEEIRFGCRLVPHGEAKWRAVLAKVLSRVTVLDFTYPAAVRAGELRAEWKQAGTPVGYEARRTELSLYPFSRTVGPLMPRHQESIGRFRADGDSEHR